MTPTAPPGALLHRRVTLLSSVLGAVIVALDGTVLTIAQPTLQRDLGATYAQVQWTSTGYLIAVACLLVPAGRLGDRYGHQRVFALGVLGFGAASAALGAAPDAGWVIGLRVVQGVFGALLQPATLGMLRSAYPPDRLGTPLAVRTSAIGVAAAAGPLLGGVLVAHFGWRSVFLLNVAPALLMGVLALTVRAPAPPPTAPASGTDLPGALLLGVTLMSLVHALVGVPEHGWTTGGAAALALSALAAAAFVRHERRAADPLLPPALLGSGPVAAALGVLVTASAAMLGALFACSYALQDGLGMDPLRTGLTALPGGLAMIVGAPVAARALRRHGARRTTLAGTLSLALGVLVLSRIGDGAPWAVTGGGFLLLGAGFGTVMVAATTVAVRHAPAAAAGVAGGLQQTAIYVGPVLGVAVAATVMSRSGGFAPSAALAALACVAALGAPLCFRLPGMVAPARVGSRSVRDHGREDVREP